MKVKNLLNTIGNTPLIKIENFLENKNVNLYAKLEGQNPGGSIKDRVALYMIEQAEKKGILDKSKIILEATSGNMGIALATVGGHKGYEVHIVMSEGMSEERKKMLKALGAKLILTDKTLGTNGAIQKANELLKQYPGKYWFSDQFNNQDNVKAHYNKLAPELLGELEKIDYFISGIGTSGTIMGVAKRFKEESPNTKIIGVIPPSGYQVQGIQNPKMDFSGKIYDEKLIDSFINISVNDAYNMAREIAKTQGIFVGMSSGAALFAANQVSKQINSGNIVILIHDRGEKYLSTKLFE